MSDNWIPKDLDEKKRLVYAIIDFLQKESEQNEDLKVAAQLLQDSYGIEYQEDNSERPTLLEYFNAGVAKINAETPTKKEEPKPETTGLKYNLPDDPEKIAKDRFNNFIQLITEKGYFNNVEKDSPEYQQRYEKAKQRYQEHQQKEMNQKADLLKDKGNKFIQQQKYREALDCYISAIELNPYNHIYYANMGAAYSGLGDSKNAIKACEISIKIEPNYAKGYSRLASIYYNDGKLEKALEYFEKALEKDPNNASYKSNIEKIKEKIESKKNQPQRTELPFGGNNPFANLGGFGGNNPFGGLGNVDFGQIGQMLQNPEFMRMATEMLQQPQFQEMMGQFMGGLSNEMANLKPSEEEMKEIEEDPEYQSSEKLQRVFAELKEQGMGAMTKYMTDVEVQTFLAKIAQKKLSKLGHNNPFAQFFNQGRDKDDEGSTGIV